VPEVPWRRPTVEDVSSRHMLNGASQFFPPTLLR
jgi:hypothetical protein